MITSTSAVLPDPTGPPMPMRLIFFNVRTFSNVVSVRHVAQHGTTGPRLARGIRSSERPM